MSITEKLNKIKSCKEDIKQAIIDKGVDMTGVSLEGYATKISEIPSGGGDYLDMRMNMSTYYSTAEYIPSFAFTYCSYLQSVNLPNCVSMGTNICQSCSSLQTANLPNCIYLGYGAFNDAINLQSVNLPNCVSVSQYAFQSCKSLLSIDLPNCTLVGAYAFNSCRSIQSVNLPKCQYIYNYTFGYCSSLQSIDLPRCLIVSQNGFVACSSLQSANLPNCVVLSNSAFQSCKSLSVLDLRSTYSCILSNSNAFSSTPFASGIGSIYVHNAVLSQFQNATNWTYFSNCFVGVGDPDIQLLAFDNGRVYGDTGMLYHNFYTYLGVSSRNITSIDLPNLTICGTKLSNMSNLQQLTLSSIEEIPNEFCFRCSSLQSIDLPMCEYVGDSAFQSCTSLQSVNLPMCSYVASSAFYGCSSLQTVNLPMCEYVGNLALYTYNNTIDTVYIGTSISKVCQAGGPQIFANNTNTNGYHVKSIFVPMSLVDAYKSAQYWSQYASLIFGI